MRQRERLRRRLKLRENELKLIMTPIKSLAMVRRPLEKAFMCKSQFIFFFFHDSFRTVSLVFHMFAMGRASHLFLGGGGGGGLAKEKQTHAKEKNEKHRYTRKHVKTFMQVSLIFGIYIT